MTHPKATERSQPLRGVILVSMPWPMVTRPSIQLGTLKAYLRHRHPGLTVDAAHLYLTVAQSVGYDDYRQVSRRTWPAESVYAALLFPDKADRAQAVFRKESAGRRKLQSVDFPALCRRVRSATDAALEAIDWSGYDLAGFSVCLCQLTATLYAVRYVRRRHPHLKIVIGGSFLNEAFVRDWLTALPEVDFAVVGEGERPLARLVDWLRRPGRATDPEEVPGLFARTPEGVAGRGGFEQIRRLDELPPPDFDDYFHTLAGLPPADRFFPTLCLEASRGCWWRKKDAAGTGRGCAFCNLNLQWEGYRAKSAKRVRSELRHLSARHRVLSAAFMDNALPPDGIVETFSPLGEDGSDYSLFAEIRPSVSRQELAALRRAGVEEVQTGIEALSTSLLHKLNKGTTAIQSLQIMKICEELGIANRANLIVHFPGSDADDVAETLRVLPFARVYRPLHIVPFWLGRGSAVSRHPEAYGVRSVFNHPHYRHLLPAELVRRLRFPLLSYRGDRVRQRKLWRPVYRAVHRWTDRYERMMRQVPGEPVLGFRDGGTFLLLHRRHPDAPADQHRLVGASRDIYLFCREHRSLAEIEKRFSRLHSGSIRSYLSLMEEKKLMFSENGRHLSLAVRRRSRLAPNQAF
ncbi:MAG: RiPP maturation radical SAM C-methyltransferase [Desulfobacteraceae bacterium]|nr:RiPP maturation radical SAM C-methyltransferase [Desulfobacteraceae bacterium]